MTADPVADPDAETRRALRLCMARLGTEPARLILAYYAFGESSERGEARRLRRQQLALRLECSDAALRNRALAIRGRLEACVAARLAGTDGAEDASPMPPAVEPDADQAARDAEREAETDRHDDYARERLTVAEYAAFTEWLAERPAEQARQRFARALRPAAEPVGRPTRTPVVRPGSTRNRGMLLTGAGIAGVLALTLSLNPHWLARPEPARVVIDTAAPTVLLLAPPADAAAAVVPLALAPRATELRVQAEIRHEEEARLYRLRVLPADSAEGAPALFEAADLPLQTVGVWRHVEARVPAEVLRNAARIIRIESQPPAGAFSVAWTVRAVPRTTPEIEVPPP